MDILRTEANFASQLPGTDPTMVLRREGCPCLFVRGSGGAFRIVDRKLVHMLSFVYSMIKVAASRKWDGGKW